MIRYQDRPRFAAGVLLQAEDTGRVLLGLRSALVRRPGLWAIFGGGVEPGESLVAAARRELQEEAGIQHANVDPVPIYVNGRFCAFYGTVPRETKPVLNWENAAAWWFDPDDLPPNLHPGTDDLVAWI